MEDLINDKQTKVCAKCGRELPVDNFYKHSKSKDGLQPYCKECTKIYQRVVNKRSRGALPSLKNFEGGNPDLARFTPRDLIEELRARGYKGELQYTYQIKV